jgi:hypothetical protein
VVQAPVVEAVARCKRLVSEEQHQRRTAMDQMVAALGGKVDAEERARTAAVSALKVHPPSLPSLCVVVAPHRTREVVKDRIPSSRLSVIHTWTMQAVIS